MDEVRPEKISSKGRELGPRLKALLLAQPLNELEPLVFRELPSKRPVQNMNPTKEEIAA